MAISAETTARGGHLLLFSPWLGFMMSGGLVNVAERRFKTEVYWRGWFLKPFELKDFAKLIKMFFSRYTWTLLHQIAFFRARESNRQL